MRQLLALFVSSGGFITFLLLEALCFFLIVSYNNNQAGIFSHSTGLLAGNVLNKRRAITQYVTAAEQVDSLQKIVAQLRTELAARHYVKVPYRDTFFVKSVDSLDNVLFTPQYRFISAQIISNSTTSRNNWFVINAGAKEGIRNGMGVVLPRGIMGVVRETRPNFAICMSILHQQSRVSARLTKQGVLGSLLYDGNDPRRLNLVDVPKHVIIEKGDMVETSGYSTLYPGGIPIGKVDTVILPPGSNFYTLGVVLENDPSQAEYVYVVENIYRGAVDSLIQSVTNK